MKAFQDHGIHRLVENVETLEAREGECLEQLFWCAGVVNIRSESVVLHSSMTDSTVACDNRSGRDSERAGFQKWGGQQQLVKSGMGIGYERSRVRKLRKGPGLQILGKIARTQLQVKMPG